MEKYRNTIKKRISMYGGLCGLVPVSALVLSWWTGRVMDNSNDHVAGFVHGMGLAFIICLMAYSIKQIFTINRALKNDAALKKMYVQETDERAIFIQNKVGSSGWRLVLILLVFAAMVASYFSATVMITLVCAALAVALVMAGYKLYYRNKY